MSAYVWLGLRSFIIAVIMVPICRDIFKSYGVVDRPDQGRKIHKHPIPRVGGIGIAIAYFLSFFLFRPEVHGMVAQELSVVWQILPAAFTIFFVGIIDDFFGLKPWQKLIGQLGGAALAYWAGVRILNVAGYTTENIWSLPITIFWLLLCTNAFNLIDGLDGLAAGVGMFATLTIFTGAILQGNQALALATLPLAACLLGFLCFNFNPATIFLGDGGSMLIGFLLGCYGVIWSQKSLTLLGMTAPLMAVAIPVLDVMLCIVRRWLKNQPIFGADRGHIHHRLLDRGFSPRRVVLILYALCGLAAGLSLVQSSVQNIYFAGLVVVLFVALVWVGVHHLGYTEFMLAGRLLREGEFQRTVSALLKLNNFEQKIYEAKTLEECWDVIQASYKMLGFQGVRLSLGDRVYQQWDEEIQEANYWTLHIPLPDIGFIEFAREFETSALPMVVGPFVDLLRSSLTAKIPQFASQPVSSKASVPAHANS